MVFHNRTGIVALAAAVLVIVLGGFGCKRATPDIPAPPTAVQDDISNVTWTEYRSEVLGITLPYPEGWYLAEDAPNQTVDFYEASPPEFSDAPSQMWAQSRSADSIDDAIAAEFPVVLARTNVEKSDRTMVRVVYPYDARLAPDVRMVAYVWQQDNEVRMMGGPEGSAVLEYTTEHLEAAQ